ncbi:MAG: ferric iron uptake transcriptional regulator [Gammaproteobacteria bacterium]|nr:ferric iron uptake transcriptional regulator [Gammaproteobacteria bacterium]
MTDQTTQDLKGAGLKVTLPRMRVLEVLSKVDDNDRHMSAEDVYRYLMTAGDDISLATIYRVLTQFEAAGLVIKHHFDGGTARYELDTGDNHNHIVCMKTGRVEEFTDKEIEAKIQTIARELGYELTDYKLTLYGVSQEAL